MSDNSMSVTGGACIGWMNATWPFARLQFGPTSLVLNATLLGRYEFSPDQVVGIEKYTVIPLLGWGVSINHNAIDYPKKIVFWCFGNPDSLIRRIHDSGFVARGVIDETIVNRGFPVRWQSIIAIVVLWNVLLGLDMQGNNSQQPGILTFSALLLLFLGSVGIWRSEFLRFIIMKPGRKPQEIKAWLYLLAFISGLMATIFLAAGSL